MEKCVAAATVFPVIRIVFVIEPNILIQVPDVIMRKTAIFGADDSQGHCIQGGIYYFHACRRCDNYPATSLANVDGGKGVGYEECPNAPTKRWKILKCKYGWKPVPMAEIVRR